MSQLAPRPPAFSPAAVRAVVFDLDGTLVDSYAPITTSLNHARAAWSLPALSVEEVRRIVGHGLEALIADQLGAEHVAAGVRLFREKYAEVFAAGTLALPGARETLRELYQRGYLLSVASNKPASFSRRILEQLEMLELLVSVMGPDLAGSTKPDPTMIERCLSEMGVRREETVYVGDMVLDVESGSRAGLPVLLVCGGSADAEALRATGQPVLGALDRLCELLPPRAAAGASVVGVPFPPDAQ